MTDSADALLQRAKIAARKDAALRRAQAHDPTGQAAQAACDHVARLLQDRFGDKLPARVMAAYMAMGDELDPITAMHAHPGPVCVPVVQGRGQPLIFHRWTPDTAMVTGTFGVRVPAVSELVVPDILIVPLLAFDARGYRLGYGGGFYDRTLAALRARGPVLAVGFAYELQEVAQVPTTDTDARLDAIITPVGLRRF